MYEPGCEWYLQGVPKNPKTFEINVLFKSECLYTIAESTSVYFDMTVIIILLILLRYLLMNQSKFFRLVREF